MFYKNISNNVPQKFIFNNNIILNHFNQQKNITSLSKNTNSEEINSNLTDLIENNKKLLHNLKYSKISPRIKNEMSQIISQQLSENRKQAPQFSNSSSINNNTLYSYNSINNSSQNNMFNSNRSIKYDIISKDFKINTNANSTVSYKKTDTQFMTAQSIKSDPTMLLHQNSGLSFNKFDSANKLKQQIRSTTSVIEDGDIPEKSFKNTIFPRNKFEFPCKNKHPSFDLTNCKIMAPLTIHPQELNFDVQSNIFTNNGLNQYISSQINFDSLSFNNKIKKNFHQYSQRYSKRSSFPMINNNNLSKINICNWQIFMTNSTPLVNDAVLSLLKLLGRYPYQALL